jgi:hypothetical protein
VFQIISKLNLEGQLGRGIIIIITGRDCTAVQECIPVQFA